MITYKKGDIFAEDVEAIVNPVNCVGVMGKGLALEFKNRYPEIFASYKEVCDNNEMNPGKLHIFKTGFISNPAYIVNFPTKNHWRDPSKLEYIENGLVDLAYWMSQLDIKSIAMPALGCGLGGLGWWDVKQLIEINLGGLENVEIIVFEPN